MDIEPLLVAALDALCDVAFSLPQESKTRQKCVVAEQGLRDALGQLLAERVPYAWEIRQGGRTFLISAQEFKGQSYEGASCKPLFEK